MPITIPYASRRHASWVDTEKLRKKIWGSETPPGQEDPYGKESVFDQRRREREQEIEKGMELEPVPEGEVGKSEEQTGYVEATTTEGLERVGWPGWGTKEWEEENSYRGFMKPERVDGRDEIILAVHRALVETYALKEAGLPLVMDYYSENPTDDYAERLAGGAKFEQDTNGQMTLVLESEELRQSILECATPRDHSSDDDRTKDTEIEEEQQEEMESGESEEKPSQIVKEDDDFNSESEGSEIPLPDEESFDLARTGDLAAFVPASDTWRNVSLEDAAIKFAVLKRVMQLTGRRIPDPEILTITTPQSLLVHLVKKPKPKRIAEALLNSNQVAELPNVQIFDKRYRPIDREVEVGRWKVITKELEKRGLPVIGRADMRNILRNGEQ
ncbi:MAG: hypothetical protein ASARMPREDX12_000594 [Alectoria sarmentosa]|nr:MAG: hypothetical protein ASARMPREDX12_000594 [Alectoria sarmentosa]